MATTTEYNLEKIAGHHVEETLGHGALIDAKHASDEEHAQTLWQAIKANKKAVGWSVLVSMSVVMEGYDTILIGNFFGYPEFQKKYGHDYGGTAGYQVSAPWQTGLGMASTVGAIFGTSPPFSTFNRNSKLTMAELLACRWNYEWPTLCKIRLPMGHDHRPRLHGCIHFHYLLRSIPARLAGG